MSCDVIMHCSVDLDDEGYIERVVPSVSTRKVGTTNLNFYDNRDSLVDAETTRYLIDI